MCVVKYGLLARPICHKAKTSFLKPQIRGPKTCFRGCLFSEWRRGIFMVTTSKISLFFFFFWKRHTPIQALFYHLLSLLPYAPPLPSLTPKPSSNEVEKILNGASFLWGACLGSLRIDDLCPLSHRLASPSPFYCPIPKSPLSQKKARKQWGWLFFVDIPWSLGATEGRPVFFRAKKSGLSLVKKKAASHLGKA